MARATIVDCLVVGAGPAGLTAAVCLRHCLREVAVLDAGACRAHDEAPQAQGGLPESFARAGLQSRLRLRLRTLGVCVVQSEVASIEREPEIGFLARSSGSVILARAVLLCTGASRESGPRSELAAMLHARLDRSGAVDVDWYGRTRIEGLYAAGDVAGALGRVTVAVGQAAIAANAIDEDLMSGEHDEMQLGRIGLSARPSSPS